MTTGLMVYLWSNQFTTSDSATPSGFLSRLHIGLFCAGHARNAPVKQALDFPTAATRIAPMVSMISKRARPVFLTLLPDDRRRRHTPPLCPCEYTCDRPNGDQQAVACKWTPNPPTVDLRQGPPRAMIFFLTRVQ